MSEYIDFSCIHSWNCQVFDDCGECPDDCEQYECKTCLTCYAPCNSYVADPETFYCIRWVDRRDDD